MSNTATNGNTGLRCVWMSAVDFQDPGRNESEPVLKQMKIDLMAYEPDTTAETIMKNPDYFCGATIFSVQNRHPIAGIPENSTVAAKDNRERMNFPPTKG